MRKAMEAREIKEEFMYEIVLSYFADSYKPFVVITLYVCIYTCTYNLNAS